MPVMNGKEAFKELKAAKDPKVEGIPILAVTASSLIQEERILRNEFDGYLRKPFSRKQLVGALEKVLPKKSETHVDDRLESSEEKTNLDSNALPMDTTEWPEVIESLSEWEGSRVVELQGSMALGEVAEFAKDLIDLANSNNCQLLHEYGSELQSHASSFEMSATETKLAEYSELIQRLKSTLGAAT